MDEALEKMRVCWGERHLTSGETQAFETAWHEGRKALVEDACKNFDIILEDKDGSAIKLSRLKTLAEVEG